LYTFFSFAMRVVPNGASPGMIRIEVQVNVRAALLHDPDYVIRHRVTRDATGATAK